MENLFDPDELEKIIDLRDKSYEMFMWLNERIKKKQELFLDIHEKMGIYKAGLEWVKRNLKSLPQNFRPAEEDVEPFVHILTSYLSTSFQVTKTERVSDGCYCPFCTFFAPKTIYQVRNPSKKSIENAEKLKARYIQGLCKEIDAKEIEADPKKWIDENDDLVYQISLATYAKEMIRRSKFYSQGEGILVLWREIAWVDGRKDPRFKLTARMVLEAEDEILKRLESS
ncbi:MAG: hypothetical protein ACFFCS_26780 [Candidatus Hodarchaeota archaeon]